MRRVIAGVVVVAAAGAAWAQCDGGSVEQWIPFVEPLGPNGTVHALLVWDPDLAGPRSEVVVIGGQFSTAGGIFANNIAAWDPATGEWIAFGDGRPDAVLSLSLLPSGLFVAGSSGLFTSSVAIWNGSEWHDIGHVGRPIYGPVFALASTASGDLIAGGDIRWSLGGPANGIARWNGSLWEPLGVGVGTTFEGMVRAISVLPSGDVVASGNFAAAGGRPANNVAIWDGVDWHSPGIGVNGEAFALLNQPASGFVMGGGFSLAGGFAAKSLAEWDGSWREYAGGIGFGRVRSLVRSSRGDVIVGGNFSSVGGGMAAGGLASWDGAAWHTFDGGTTGTVMAITLLATGDMIVGGEFSSIAGVSSPNLIRWRCRCRADCDGDGDGDLSFFDFLCFQNLLLRATPRRTATNPAAWTSSISCASRTSLPGGADGGSSRRS